MNLNENTLYFIGDEAFSQFNNWLLEHKDNYSRLFVLGDENTMEFCLGLLASSLEALDSFELLEVPAGEASKSLEVAGELCAALAEMHADRNSLLMVLGGGMVGDLGAFVASIYKRGIPLVLIPTSLLAMTDAAIGGKTAVDYQSVKNLIGTFYPAVCTLICTDFLNTLPETEYQSGYAEMLKHALMASPALWLALSHHFVDFKEDSNMDLLAQSMSIKMNLVKQDPFEQNVRKTLNLGHTTAHALEAHYLSLGLHCPHGWAVAAGLFLAAYLSELKGLLITEQAFEIKNRLKGLYDFSALQKIAGEQLLPFVLMDKKNVGSEIRMVLLTAIGQAICDVKVHEEEWLLAFKNCFNVG